MTTIENQYDFIEFIKKEIINYEVEFMFSKNSEWIKNNKNTTVNEFEKLLSNLTGEQRAVMKEISKMMIHDCFFHFFSVLENKEPFNGNFGFFFHKSNGEKMVLNELNPDFLSTLIAEDYDW